MRLCIESGKDARVTDSLFMGAGRYDLGSLGLLNGPAEPAFVQVAHIAAVVARAPITTVSLYDHSTGIMRLRAAHGLTEPEQNLCDVPVEKALLSRLRDVEEVVSVSQVLRDPRTLDDPVALALNARSLLAACVFCPADEAIGLLTVYDLSPRIWSREELSAVRELAGFATQAVMLRAALQTIALVTRVRARGGA